MRPGPLLLRALVGAVVAVVVGIAAGFGLRVASVVTAFDVRAIHYLALNREPGVTELMRGFTWLGGTVLAAVVLAVAAGAAYWRTRQPRWPAFFAGTIAGAVGLDNLIKLVVDRPRPHFHRLTDIAGSSFPSGHSATGAAMFLALAYLATRGPRGTVPARFIWAVAITITVVVASSRVYLGAHWPSDVAGGMLLGAYWTGVMASLTRARAAPGGDETAEPGGSGALRGPGVPR
jgi:undecaprenyl-diphosphatase